MQPTDAAPQPEYEHIEDDGRADYHVQAVADCRAEMARIIEKDVATANLLSFSFGAYWSAQLARTKRSEELIVPGRNESRSMFFQ